MSPQSDNNVNEAQHLSTTVLSVAAPATTAPGDLAVVLVTSARTRLEQC